MRLSLWAVALVSCLFYVNIESKQYEEDYETSEEVTDWGEEIIKDVEREENERDNDYLEYLVEKERMQRVKKKEDHSITKLSDTSTTVLPSSLPTTTVSTPATPPTTVSTSSVLTTTASSSTVPVSTVSTSTVPTHMVSTSTVPTTTVTTSTVPTSTLSLSKQPTSTVFTSTEPTTTVITTRRPSFADIVAAVMEKFLGKKRKEETTTSSTVSRHVTTPTSTTVSTTSESTTVSDNSFKPTMDGELSTTTKSTVDEHPTTTVTFTTSTENVSGDISTPTDVLTTHKEDHSSTAITEEPQNPSPESGTTTTTSEYTTSERMRNVSETETTIITKKQSESTTKAEYVSTSTASTDSPSTTTFVSSESTVQTSSESPSSSSPDNLTQTSSIGSTGISSGVSSQSTELLTEVTPRSSSTTVTFSIETTSHNPEILPTVQSSKNTEVILQSESVTPSTSSLLNMTGTSSTSFYDSISGDPKSTTTIASTVTPSVSTSPIAVVGSVPTISQLETLPVTSKSTIVTTSHLTTDSTPTTKSTVGQIDHTRFTVKVTESTVLSTISLNNTIPASSTEYSITTTVSSPFNESNPQPTSTYSTLNITTTTDSKDSVMLPMTVTSTEERDVHINPYGLQNCNFSYEDRVFEECNCYDSPEKRKLKHCDCTLKNTDVPFRLHRCVVHGKGPLRSDSSYVKQPVEYFQNCVFDTEKFTHKSVDYDVKADCQCLENITAKASFRECQCVSRPLIGCEQAVTAAFLGVGTVPFVLIVVGVFIVIFLLCLLLICVVITCRKKKTQERTKKSTKSSVERKMDSGGIKMGEFNDVQDGGALFFESNQLQPEKKLVQKASSRKYRTQKMASKEKTKTTSMEPIANNESTVATTVPPHDGQESTVTTMNTTQIVVPTTVSTLLPSTTLRNSTEHGNAKDSTVSTNSTGDVTGNTTGTTTGTTIDTTSTGNGTKPVTTLTTGTIATSGEPIKTTTLDETTPISTTTSSFPPANIPAKKRNSKENAVPEKQPKDHFPLPFAIPITREERKRENGDKWNDFDWPVERVNRKEKQRNPNKNQQFAPTAYPQAEVRDRRQRNDGRREQPEREREERARQPRRDTVYPVASGRIVNVYRSPPRRFDDQNRGRKLGKREEMGGDPLVNSQMVCVNGKWEQVNTETKDFFSFDISSTSSLD